MGVVYLAQDTLLKRQVAIKTVLPPQGQEAQEWRDVVRRLIREAQAAAGLKHPNIVGVYDLIQDGDMGVGRGLVWPLRTGSQERLIPACNGNVQGAARRFVGLLFGGRARAVPLQGRTGQP